MARESPPSLGFSPVSMRRYTVFLSACAGFPPELFENNTLVSALVDRLTFRSHVLDMSGPSYRLLTAQASANQ